MACAVCEHADVHGWWGQSGTHCRKCHRSWRSLHQVHCVTCCAHFVSHNACDEHLTSSGCRDPQLALTRAGKARLAQRQSKDGPIWGFPAPLEMSPFPEGAVTDVLETL